MEITCLALNFNSFKKLNIEKTMWNGFLTKLHFEKRMWPAYLYAANCVLILTLKKRMSLRTDKME